MRKQNIANIYFRWGYRTDGSSLCTFRTLRNECHCIAMDSHFFRSLSFDLSNPQAKKFFVFEFVLVRFAAAIFFLDYFHANWTHSRCNSCIYLQIECTDNSMRTNFVAIIVFIWWSESAVQWPLLNGPLHSKCVFPSASTGILCRRTKWQKKNHPKPNLNCVDVSREKSVCRLEPPCKWHKEIKIRGPFFFVCVTQKMSRQLKNMFIQTLTQLRHWNNRTARRPKKNGCNHCACKQADFAWANMSFGHRAHFFSAGVLHIRFMSGLMFSFCIGAVCVYRIKFCAENIINNSEKQRNQCTPKHKKCTSSIPLNNTRILSAWNPCSCRFFSGHKSDVSKNGRVYFSCASI